MSSIEPPPAIKKLILKQFLTAIEELNQPLHEIVAKNVLTTQSAELGLYGKPENARYLQQRFYDLKRGTLANYKILLDNHGVTASSATLRGLAEEDTGHYFDEETGNYADDEVDGVSEALERSCVIFSTPPHSTPPRSHSTPSPNGKPLTGYHRRPLHRSPTRTFQMSDVTPPSVPHGVASVAGSSVSDSTISLGPGSESNPHMKDVNVVNPELNDVFQITKVSKFVHNENAWTGWDLRKVVSGPDRDKWSVRWFSPTQLLVNGPSQDCMLDAENHHNEMAKVTSEDFDDATRNAHLANDAAIQRSRTGNTRWWLLNFPAGTSLDPSLLLNGGTSHMLQRRSNFITIPKAVWDTTNDIKGVAIYFQILERGTGVPTKSETEKLDNLKDWM